MPDTTKRSVEVKKKSRPGTSKRAQARLAAFRARRAKQRRRKAERPVKEEGNVQARVALENLVGGKLSGRYDSLYLASKLFAIAVQEARTILDPTALMMALVAIGKLDETDDVSDMYGKIENILMEVPNNLG